MATIDWDAVFAAVEAKEGALLERLRQIIRIDNCIPPGRNYDTLLDLVEPQFQKYGFATERVMIPEELWRALPPPPARGRGQPGGGEGGGKPPPTTDPPPSTGPTAEGRGYGPT